MAIALFYFLGNSDLAINGDTRKWLKDKNIKGSFREITEKIWKILNELPESEYRISKDGIYLSEGIEVNNYTIKSLSIPILVKILDYISKKEKRKVDKIYLFYTDQREGNNNKDTVYLSKLAENYLKANKYKDELEMIEISGNPSDWEYMAEFLYEFIKEREKEIKYNSENYLSITTGTPAGYTTMALALLRYKYNIRYLYVFNEPNQQEGVGEIKEVRVFHKKQEEYDREFIEMMLKNYNYNIWDKIPSIITLENKDILAKIFRALHYSLNNDFEKCNEVLKEFPGEIREKEYLREFRNFISDILYGKEEAIIKDLYSKIEIKYERGEYIEFVALLFNFMEIVGQNLFKKITGVKIEKDGTGKLTEFNKFIESNIELKERLEKENIRWQNNSNSIVIRKILNFYKEKGKINNKEAKEIEVYRKFCENLEKEIDGLTLRELRNHGPYAHGIRGLSEEVLKKFHNAGGRGIIKEWIEDKFKDIYNLENIYKQLNENLIKLIKL